MTLRVLLGSVSSINDGDRFAIDMEARVVHRGATWTVLPPHELNLFRHLLLTYGSVQNKDQILDALYPDTPSALVPEIKIIDVYIYKMKPMLPEIGCEIETIWGRGHMLKVNEMPVAA